MGRKDWDAYFYDIATMVASRSTCKRRRVGCVITFEKHILSTGFNGARRGLPHCGDEGALACDNGGCQNSIHAEENAVKFAIDFFRYTTQPMVMYCTVKPCDNCEHICKYYLPNMEIKYLEEYR